MFPEGAGEGPLCLLKRKEGMGATAAAAPPAAAVDEDEL